MRVGTVNTGSVCMYSYSEDCSDYVISEYGYCEGCYNECVISTVDTGTVSMAVIN
jgi:hypothetical protein